MYWQLLFVGSASGFYFPYDFCLYGNMSSQMAYFIRFLPLFVAIITCAIVLCFRSATPHINEHKDIALVYNYSTKSVIGTM